MASSDVVKKPPSRRTPAAGRAGRAMAVLGGVRRTTLLLLLAAVVLSLGMVAGNGSGEDRTASFSEIAQTDARAAALALTRQAEELADADSSEALAAELSRQAAVLDEQSVLLVRAGTFRSGVPPFPAAPSGAVPASDADTDADTDAQAAAYVRSLTDSARASLDAALRADAGTARLLAVTGAAQQVMAMRAAEAAGLDSPEPWTPLPQAGGGSRCKSGATASPGSPAAGSPAAADRAADSDPVPDAASALQGAVDAEFGAAYAYEVGMARTAGAGARAVLEEHREDHLAAGAEGVQLLPEVCLPALTRAPAYSLPPSFAADPGDALDSLESSLPGVYADLTALGTGPVRAWAVERLAELSAGLYAKEESVPAAPGLDLEAAGLPRTPGTA